MLDTTAVAALATGSVVAFLAIRSILRRGRYPPRPSPVPFWPAPGVRRKAKAPRKLGIDTS
jgi:hypothetical protein